MPTKKSPAVRRAKPALRLVRTFDAPRDLVFAAWTESRHMKQWSAPHGFKIPVSEGDLRPGGAWRAAMVTPDGVRLGLHGTYRKIIPGKLLVFTHQWDDEDDAPETLVTVRLAAAPGGRTKMTFTQTGFDSAGSRDGHAGGWSQGFERLVELLAKLRKKTKGR